MPTIYSRYSNNGLDCDWFVEDDGPLVWYDFDFDSYHGVDFADPDNDQRLKTLDETICWLVGRSR
jgi:hypothetical protein